MDKKLKEIDGRNLIGKTIKDIEEKKRGLKIIMDDDMIVELRPPKKYDYENYEDYDINDEQDFEDDDYDTCNNYYNTLIYDKNGIVINDYRILKKKNIIDAKCIYENINIIEDRIFKYQQFYITLSNSESYIFKCYVGNIMSNYWKFALELGYEPDREDILNDNEMELTNLLLLGYE